MTKYKYAGIFTLCRTIRRWIVIADGEEFPFNKKKYALMAAAASRARGKETKLIEDTTLRFRSPAAIDFHDEKFQIDISNQIP